MTHAIFAVLLYDQDDPARKASKTDFETLAPEAGQLLTQAAGHLPDKAEAIGKFKDRFAKIVEEAKEPMAVSIETPGLIHGIGIQQIDLIQMGHGASLATDVDTHLRSLIADMHAFNNELLSANAAASQGLTAKASAAVVSMAVLGVVSTLLAGAFALWMSSSKITRPLSRMIERMRTLAQGHLDVEIDGLGRRDEVGEMADAVQVFKTNAIERVRVEKEAAEHRAEVESERRRVESGESPPPLRRRAGRDAIARRWAIAGPRGWRSDLAARPAVPLRIRHDPRRLQRRGTQIDGDGTRGGGEHGDAIHAGSHENL